MKLLNGKSATRAFNKLVQAAAAGGAEVHTRGGGWSDYPVLAALESIWLVERFSGGPRGGARWRITPRGQAALDEARRELEWRRSGGPEAEAAARKLSRQLARAMKRGKKTEPAAVSSRAGLGL